MTCEPAVIRPPLRVDLVCHSLRVRDQVTAAATATGGGLSSGPDAVVVVCDPAALGQVAGRRPDLPLALIVDSAHVAEMAGRARVLRALVPAAAHLNVVVTTSHRVSRWLQRLPVVLPVVVVPPGDATALAGALYRAHAFGRVVSGRPVD